MISVDRMEGAGISRSSLVARWCLPSCLVFVLILMLGRSVLAATPAGKAEEIAALLGNAYTQINAGNFPVAEQHLVQARAIDPDNAWVALNLGVIYQRTNRIDLAAQEYQRVIEKSQMTEKTAGLGQEGSTGKSLVEIAEYNLKLMGRPLVRSPLATQAVTVPQVTPGATAPPQRAATSPQTASGPGSGQASTAASLPAQASPGAGTPPALSAMRGQQNTAPSINRSGLRRDVLTALVNWRDALVNRRFQDYIACYAPNFSGHETDRSAWQARVSRELFGVTTLSPRLDAIKVEFVNADRAMLSFAQVNSVNNLQDSKSKKLGFRRSADKWLIDEEVTLP